MIYSRITITKARNDSNLSTEYVQELKYIYTVRCPLCETLTEGSIK